MFYFDVIYTGYIPISSSSIAMSGVMSVASVVSAVYSVGQTTAAEISPSSVILSVQSSSGPSSVISEPSVSPRPTEFSTTSATEEPTTRPHTEPSDKV